MKNQNLKSIKKQETARLKNKAQQRQSKQQKRSQFYYSFLTIVLLICLAQIGLSAILNISKIIAYQNKITTMTKIKTQAESRNKHLKQEIKNFSSMETLEAIARNNLKMAGEDEVLVIINSVKDEDIDETKDNKTFIQFPIKKNKN